jgi:prepilin-type processing-associated H-X9-DG protein
MGLGFVTSLDDPRHPWRKTDAEGRVLHSWQTHLLATGAVEGWVLSGTVDWDKPWDDPRNSAYFRGIVVPFLNPEIGRLRDDRGYALSHYAGNRHVLGIASPIAMTHHDASTGSSQTVVAGEVSASFRAWGDPDNLRDPGIGISTSENGFGGPSGEGANLLFLDGSVRFVTRTADPAVLRALSGARP